MPPVSGALRASVVLAISLLVGCARSPTPPAAAPGAYAPGMDGKALFERKCGLCHPADWAEGAASTMEEWKKLVARKQAMKAGWISDEEAAAIIEHRSHEYAVK